jgi:hypothetical protein
MNKMLEEKYNFPQQDAIDLADFLVPLLDFVPEKRPTAEQALLHGLMVYLGFLNHQCPLGKQRTVMWLSWKRRQVTIVQRRL